MERKLTKVVWPTKEIKDINVALSCFVLSYLKGHYQSADHRNFYFLISSYTAKSHQIHEKI